MSSAYKNLSVSLNLAMEVIENQKKEITRLQAIAEAAGLMAQSLMQMKVYRRRCELGNHEMTTANIFNDEDAAALAAYEKAKAGGQ